MYIFIIIFPFIGFLLAGGLGKYFGREGSAILSTFGLLLTLITALLCFYEVALCNTVISINIYTWVLLDIYNINIGLLFDTITVTMVLVISSISFFVHLYSIAYMSHDPHISRFMAWLSFFTFFMLILVTSDNYFQLFLGWEGVGLCSYLLINFWFTRILANKAAINAMLVNRISDVFFTLAIIIIFLTFKSTNYNVVFNLIPLVANDKIIFLNILINRLDIIAFFLFIGAIGKSAQIIFHVWLPLAMEGPTPVSALLHAATMVTAGVFLIIRSSIFMEYSNTVLVLLCIFGSITAIFSGIVATFQYDVKRIIAYSTCSQLGYMFFSCGLSNYNVAFFHLFNHAFFKALLFLSAGALIHALFDEQDLRKMGKLLWGLPLIYIAMIIGSLAILGFPFLSGFYSKDLILELVYSRYNMESIFVYILALMGALFTASYSLKVIFYIFFTKANFSYIIYKYWNNNLIEVTDKMSVSIFSLIVLSIISGFLFSDMFIGYGTIFWNNGLYISLDHFFFLDIEYINPFIKNMPIILSLLVMIILFFILDSLFYLFKNYKLFFIRSVNIYNNIAPFFYYALFFNKIYNYLYSFIIKCSYLIFIKYVDKGLLEVIGPFGVYKLFKKMNNILVKSLTSLIFFYIYLFFICLSICIFILIIINVIDLIVLLNNLFLFSLLIIIFIH
jgi:NADH-ubiquinone oxidoreductase chain 5